MRSSRVSQLGSSRLGARSGMAVRAPWLTGSAGKMVARSLASSGISVSVGMGWILPLALWRTQRVSDV